MPDNNFQNQGQGQSQGQQGDLGNDAIDKGIDTENDGDMGTGNDVVGVDGSVLNPDGSPEGTDLNGNEDLTPNVEAEDDPQANRNEQAAT
ncbi:MULTISPECIES: hypothetical protein [Asticcacaulis]|uniref:hypothetical protein n=1 Tax=Asticcacaulis TaxID=76890 RepID=UPI001AE43235|nr:MULTISPECIES: hypothetical protein [Asticcacaulis]MBP2158793.1 hypothetical protein [Asticcacaulis solisilvae]MDR6799839.1 hypothetical protein [Asticcacaulis sp. BE141]